MKLTQILSHSNQDLWNETPWPSTRIIFRNVMLCALKMFKFPVLGTQHSLQIGPESQKNLVNFNYLRLDSLNQDAMVKLCRLIPQLTIRCSHLWNFKVFMPVIFWILTPRSLVGGYQHFRGIHNSILPWKLR